MATMPIGAIGCTVGKRPYWHWVAPRGTRHGQLLPPEGTSAMHQRLDSIRCYSHENEPDWDQEMSIFKKRTLRPNQLASLRKLEEEKVTSGKVRMVYWILDSNQTSLMAMRCCRWLWFKARLQLLKDSIMTLRVE